MMRWRAPWRAAARFPDLKRKALLLHLILDESPQILQAGAPKQPIRLEPLVDLRERAAVHGIHTRAHVEPFTHQSRPPQDAKVPRYCGPADRELPRQVARRALTGAQRVEEGAARGIGDCPKRVDRSRMRTCNHMVTLNANTVNRKRRACAGSDF